MATADAGTRRQQRRDPLDARAMWSPEAEREALAYIIDTLTSQTATAREIVAALTPETLQGDGAVEVRAAIVEALRNPTPARADVYAALRRAGHGIGTDPHTLLCELAPITVGGGPLAARLARQAADELLGLAARRRAIEAAQAIVEADGCPEDMAVLVRQLEQARKAAGPRRLTLTDCVDAWEKHDRTPVVPTSLGWFDGPTEGGLPIGGITALVAYPQVGKTALALQLTLAALLRDDQLRAVWALGEMMPQGIAGRMACVASTLLYGVAPVTMAMSRGRHPAARAANAALAAEVGDRLVVEPAPLSMDRIEQAVVDTGARLVVIDYVQLIRGTDPRADRVAELDGIIGRIREMAITRECAVIAISSMAKAAGTRSRIGQLAKGTGEIDYAVELLYVGQAEERDGKPAYRPDGTLDVTWQCRKARNLEARDLVLEFDGSTQTYGVPGFDEFADFAPR